MPADILDLSNQKLTHYEDTPKRLMQYTSILLNGNDFSDLSFLPNFLPKLLRLDLSDNNLHSLKGFPQDLPELRFLYLNNNPLTTLMGLPPRLPFLNSFQIERCSNLMSLEGISIMPDVEFISAAFTPLLNCKGITSEFANLQLIDFKKYSVTGQKRKCDVPLNTLSYLPPEQIHIFVEVALKSNNFPNLTPYAQDLLRRANVSVARNLFGDDDFFIHENLVDELVEYYRLTPEELVAQYAKSHDLSQMMMERLAHECTYEQRNFLETSVDPDDPIRNLLQQNRRFYLRPPEFPIIL